MADEPDDFKPALKTISASINTTMAISEDGDLYVWGKTFLKNKNIKHLPTKLGLPNQYLFYRVVHVSQGLNHGAAILQSCLDKECEGVITNQKGQVQTILGMVADQAKKLKENSEQQQQSEYFLQQWDQPFKEFFKSKNNKTILNLSEFRQFYRQDKHLKNISYQNISEVKTILGTGDEANKDEPNAFEKFFMMEKSKDGKTEINICYYYQMLTQESRPEYIAIVWGNPANGRLGAPKSKFPNESDKQTIFNNNNPSQMDFTSRQMQQPSRTQQVQNSQYNLNQAEPNNSDFIQPIALKQEFVKIVCGHHHTMALTEEGAVFIWGMGSQGCLGNGRVDDLETPTQIDISGLFFNEIAAGAYHSLALAKNNQVYGWGVNNRGQLGIGNKENQLLPKQLTFFDRKKIQCQYLYCGDQHSACITTNKELYTWGNGDYYRLGHGMLLDEMEPKKIEILQDVYVLDVALGTIHSLCITNEGFVYAWGSSKDSVLGMPTQQYKDQTLPQRVGLMSQSFRDASFYQVAAGTSHSLSLSENGHLYVWGSNKNSLLGVRLQGQEHTCVPQKVEQSEDLEKSCIEKALFFNLKKEEQQMMKDEKLVTFEQTTLMKTILQSTMGQSHECKYKFATLGTKNTYFIDNTGHLYACGSNQKGMLCKNPHKKQKFKQFIPQKDPPDILFEQSFTPIEIVYFRNTIIRYISCQYNHCIAVTAKGNAYCWGSNQYNQLGLGFQSDHVFTPILLEGAIEQKVIIMAITGEKFSALLTDQGEVWSFGTSEFGVLGHELKNFYVIMEPRMINDIPSMINLACSNQTMFAIDQKQQLWAWGNNQFGQLGISLQRDEEEINLQTNKQVSSEFLEWKAQLKSLKNPERYIVYQPDKPSTRSITGEAFVDQVSCGLYHTCIITTNQELLTCGLAKYAGHQSQEPEDPEQQQAQQAQFIDAFSSTLEHSSKKFKLVACHEYHTVAVTVSSDLVFLGPEGKERGLHEKFANLFRDGKQMPVELQNIKFVACGPNHALILNDQGQTYTWGATMGGRLGLHINEIGLLDGQEKLIIPYPTKIECEVCKDNKLQAKNNKDKDKSAAPKKKEKKKGKNSKAKKKNPGGDQQLDVSIEDEEILDEESFHSEEGPGVRVQDPLQKGLSKQSQECEQENLYLQDAEIEKKVQFIFKDSAIQAYELQKMYTEIVSKLSWSIDYRARQLAAKNQSRQITNLKFSVPQFIVKNIQLYECIFSCMYHHPCYMIKLIQANQLNKFQLLKFIKVIFKNDLMEAQNQSIILTLAIKSFEIEFNNATSQLEYISELKLFKSSSVFLQIYYMFIQKDEDAFKYFDEIANLLIKGFAFSKILEEIHNFEKRPEEAERDDHKLKNFFNFHQENANSKEIQAKYDVLTELIIFYIKSIVERKEKCRIKGDEMISSHIKYLHNQIVQIMKKKILKDELVRITEVVEEESKVQQKLQKFQVKLDEKIGSFLLHLYYGSITEFILKFQDQIQSMPEEIRPFLHNDQNLRQIAQTIDRFFQKDVMLPNKYNQNLNKIISSRMLPKINLLGIQDVAQDLQGFVQFSVENLNMIELIQECFEIKDRYMQVEIQDILFLQHFYCSQILNNGLQAVSKFFARGMKDPIYIIFRHLEFREIQVNMFSTEILKRKINLKLMPTPIMQLIRKSNDIGLYKCEDCSILLTTEYITAEKLKSLQNLFANGWSCAAGHHNNITVLDCESPGCSNFITDQALKTMRVLRYYYREKDDNIDMLVEILSSIPTIPKGINMYNFLRDLQKTNWVKRNSRLTTKIEQFLSKIFPSELTDPFIRSETEDAELALQQVTEDQKQAWTILAAQKKLQREEALHKQYKIVYEKAVIQMNERSQHRALQITYNDLIRQLELTRSEMKSDLHKEIKTIKSYQDFIQQNIKVYAEGEVQQQERAKGQAYGFYTSANMFQAKALVKLTFQNRQIPKILKNVKFYFFGQSDGGWDIQLVYLQDSLLNLLVTCIEAIYPIELSLYKISIPIDQYLELRRMAKYRTQITFKSKNIEITFNIVQLISIFNSLEARLIK
ncbi:unnamed protein product (macronuclear) [Paramecium tetraurelia]|uniref:RCC1-like domain-containing protein n=1 Tax=Paramecium tetraurelia TaxID=5888 RepID=A0CUW9_PARTE|nr:uncharacterized protein GSPATT00010754001 [Paramecium tetraurelia]CAK74586.1 unnamed protein product [Paramecium tetraurelia]|eukprot:XP_001441983.1 hypothetical protein (macronuclear) [Paramecium tetraurelia strain d4-2]